MAMVFKSLESALKAGFQVYSRIPEGLLVRTMTQTGWTTALVLDPVIDGPQ